jgi:hypothetical protein
LAKVVAEWQQPGIADLRIGRDESHPIDAQFEQETERGECIRVAGIAQPIAKLYAIRRHSSAAGDLTS